MGAMADLDPFGRKKGDDPLASLGWSGSDDSAAEPEVAADGTGADEPLAGLTAEPDRPSPPAARAP